MLFPYFLLVCCAVQKRSLSRDSFGEEEEENDNRSQASTLYEPTQPNYQQSHEWHTTTQEEQLNCGQWGLSTVLGFPI